MSKFDYINKALNEFTKKDKEEWQYRASAKMIGNTKGVGVPRSEAEKQAIAERMKGNESRKGQKNSEFQKQAARKGQLKRTTKSRKEAWEKVDQAARVRNYKDREGHRQKAIDNMKHKRKKLQAFYNGELVGTFESIMEASRTLGINSGSISMCLKNPSWSAKGYKFQTLIN